MLHTGGSTHPQDWLSHQHSLPWDQPDLRSVASSWTAREGLSM